MSTRILIRPAYFGEDRNDIAGADAVIQEGATDEEVDRVAAQWAWNLPLKIFTPSENDPKYKRLVQTLSDKHSMDSDCYMVYVKKP